MEITHRIFVIITYWITYCLEQCVEIIELQKQSVECVLRGRKQVGCVAGMAQTVEQVEHIVLLVCLGRQASRNIYVNGTEYRFMRG